MHQSGRPRMRAGAKQLAPKIISPAHTPLKSDFYNKIGQKSRLIALQHNHTAV